MEVAKLDTPPPSIIPTRKTPIFLIIGVATFLIGLFTPKILVTFPLMVAIIAGLVAIIRKEKAYWIAILTIILSVSLLISVNLELSNLGKKIQNLGSQYPKEKHDSSYLQSVQIEDINWTSSYGGDHATFKARVKNNGYKIITHLKANVEIYDKKKNMIHSATIHDFGDIYPNSVKEISTFTSIPKKSHTCRIFLTEVRTKE